MNQKEKAELFCANCEAPAVAVLEGDTDTPICETCLTAYEWGQANFEQIWHYLDDPDEKH